MKANDKVKVHMYDTRNQEINTRQKDKVFTVYEKDGKLGIDWNGADSKCKYDDTKFEPISGFSHTVIFENVKTGERFHFDTISNSIQKVA